MNINAAEFKAKCLKLIDDVARTREPLVITKHGRPMARLVAIEDASTAEMFGYMKGAMTIEGDIVGPLDEPWSAESDEELALYADLQAVK